MDSRDFSARPDIPAQQYSKASATTNSLLDASLGRGHEVPGLLHSNQAITMIASQKPPSHRDLCERASTADLLANNPSLASQTWINSANKLLDEGKNDYAHGELDTAFIKIQKGISIVLEVIPKHRDFNVNDIKYTLLRQKAKVAMDTVENLKRLIIFRSESWERSNSDLKLKQQSSSIPNSPTITKGFADSSRHLQIQQNYSSQTTKSSPFSPSDCNYLDSLDFKSGKRNYASITCKQLFDIIAGPFKSVLILDVRPKEEYILGHIAWKRPRSANSIIHGGVVNIEPEWLKSESVESDSFELFLNAFGSSILHSKLFEARNQYDIVVLLDASSFPVDSSSTPFQLADIICNFEFNKISKENLVMLQGGYTAWSDYVQLLPVPQSDWVEIGEGCGITEVDNTAMVDELGNQSKAPLQQSISSNNYPLAQRELLSTKDTPHLNLDANSLSKDHQKSPVPLPQHSSSSLNEPQVIRSVHEYVNQRGASSNFDHAVTSRNINQLNTSGIGMPPGKFKAIQDQYQEQKLGSTKPFSPPPVSSKYNVLQSTGSHLKADEPTLSQVPTRIPFGSIISNDTNQTSGLSGASQLSNTPPQSTNSNLGISIMCANASQRPLEKSSSQEGSSPNVPEYATYPAVSPYPRKSPNSTDTFYTEHPTTSMAQSSTMESELDFNTEMTDFIAAYPELSSPTREAPAIPAKPAALERMNLSRPRMPNTTFSPEESNTIPLATQQISPSSSSLLKPNPFSSIPSRQHLSPPSPPSTNYHSSMAHNVKAFNPELIGTTSFSTSPLMPKAPNTLAANNYSSTIITPKPTAMRRTSSSSPSTTADTQRVYHPLQAMNNNTLMNRLPLPNLRPPENVAHRFIPRNTPNTTLSDLNTLQIRASSTELGMAGLRNLGNTCFMNSIIQCLSGTTLLTRFFLTGTYRKFINRANPLGSKGTVVESYSALIQTIYRAQETVVVPSEFKSVISEVLPSFSGNDQHDSQEFLSALLDALHEDLNISRTGPEPTSKPMQMISRDGRSGTHVQADDDTEGIPDEVLLEKEWQLYCKRNKSIVVDTFQGLLKSRLRCLTCNKTSTTFNPFMYLSLPIPTKNRNGVKGGPVLLDDCLKLFVEEEILDGDNAWMCPRCKTRRRATKKLTIATLPVILLIHFKRFSFDGPFRNKVGTYVYFKPNDLNLSSYLMPSSTLSNTLLLNVNTYSYNLFAVSNHFGSLSGGHYTAQVKNEVLQQWYNFDDSKISSIDEKTIQSEAAYILFYVRSDTEGSCKKWWNMDPHSML
ncbi:ubiquitin-specific protease doa4 [Batrachochytrium dendrobatidis]|nr:ubiquitin-specific protease doa4 [Batrachochytrium dendrobatidis]